MTEFSPKNLFQSLHKDETEALQRERSERWMKLAFTAALAELACRGASSDEIKGARAFVDVLLNLPDTQKLERIPIKSLEVLGRETVPEPLKPKEEKK
jgi:hypothetical protein